MACRTKTYIIWTLTITYQSVENTKQHASSFVVEGITYVNLQAPCILYIGQTYRYSTEYTFYIFSQQIYLIIFLEFLSPSSFIPPQNFVYFLMLHFLVHKIFTLYTNGVLNCKCPAPEPKG